MAEFDTRLLASRMTEDLSEQLAALEEKQQLIKDRVRAVRLGVNAGVFLCGPPGTGKTKTVLDACAESLHPPCEYYRGHITLVGLIDLIADHSQSTLILDDVHALLEDPRALQVLLAAMGSPDWQGDRIVRYKRDGRDEVIRFRGGIIAISNLQLVHGNGRSRRTLEAISSRAHVLEFRPTDGQMAAFMLHLASKGWQDHSGERHLESDVCEMVAKALIHECARLARPLDLRQLLDKALPDYWLWSHGETEHHWTDLVHASVSETTSSSAPSGQSQRLARERELVREICREHQDRSQRIKAWRDATIDSDTPNGRSQRAFYRRKAELDQGE